MQTITKPELINLLKNVRGTTFIAFEAETDIKVKKGCPYTPKRVSTVNGAIGFNYTNSVNSQRIKEGLSDDFLATLRQWGDRIPGTPLVEHKGKYYLEVKVEKSESQFFSNNNRITFDKIEPWMYSSKSRQGVNNEVIIRDYSINNISRIKINKQEYRVV